MDLNQVASETLAQLESDGYIREAVEKQMKWTTDKVVEELFGRYSPFAKALEAKVSEQLQVNLDKLDLPSYGAMVLNVVQQQLDVATHLAGVEKIKESLAELLGDPAKEYKLSELIDELKKDACRLGDPDEYSGQEVSLHIERGSTLTFLYFDQEEGKEKYKCKFGLTLRTKEGEVNSVRIDDKEFDNRVIMGGLYGLEKTLFRMFTHGSKLILDENQVDRYYESFED